MLMVGKSRKKWARVETPDIERVNLVFNRNKDPELVSFIQSIPFGSLSSVIRSALYAYMETEEAKNIAQGRKLNKRSAKNSFSESNVRTNSFVSNDNSDERTVDDFKTREPALVNENANEVVHSEYSVFTPSSAEQLTNQEKTIDTNEAPFDEETLRAMQNFENQFE